MGVGSSEVTSGGGKGRRGYKGSGGDVRGESERGKGVGGVIALS